ncbi:MAG TPA: hypothetical protein VIH27_03325 [Nitrososphaerales archaeon]
MIIRWGFFPPEVRNVVRPILLNYLWLVPPWIRVLHLGYGVSKTDNYWAEGSSETNEHYRWTNITIFGHWLDSNESNRRLSIIHELLHISLAPMAEEHVQVINRLFEDGEAPKFRATLNENWKRVMESAVQDLAFSISLIPDIQRITLLNDLSVLAFTEEEDEPGGK